MTKSEREYLLNGLIRVSKNLIAKFRRDPVRFFRYWTPLCIFNNFMVFLDQKENPEHPWLTKQANAILPTLLKQTDEGLEWGSGRSTFWFAQRIKHLTSVEHDEEWYESVSSKLKAANISNVDYLLCKVAEEKPKESPYVQVVNTFSKDGLDFVLIDGLYRDTCANMVLEKIRPGGILVIDNATLRFCIHPVAAYERAKDATPPSEEWARFLDRVKDWRLIWTSNGVWATAIWLKPVLKSKR